MLPSARRSTLLVCLSLLTLPALAQAPHVEFVWSGALQPTSIRIVAGLTGPSDSVRVALAGGPRFADAFYSDYHATDEDSRVVSVVFDALTPDRHYYYAVEVGGALDTLRIGQFRTPPVGPFSFTIAMGACAMTGSSRPVFDVIRRQNPLFFLHLGDMHYENIDAADPEVYREAWRGVLRSRSQSALYRSTPIAYTWDDHDFGPNNSDRLSPGRSAARQAYREMIPHYPLAAGAGDAPIHQAFSIGRVRFILTDLRSSRTPVRSWQQNPSMMGERQKDWFKQQLLAAKQRGELIAWVNVVPWSSRPHPESDSWGGYAAARREIADFLKEHAITNLVIISGDAHMVAMDDGTNSDYATGGGAPIPVLQSAPLDQAGSRKGGPYSEGAIPGQTVFPPHDGQFTLMTVEDEGGEEVCVRWDSYRTKWDSPSTRPIMEMETCFAMEPYRADIASPEFPDLPEITFPILELLEILFPDAEQREAATPGTDGDR